MILDGEGSSLLSRVGVDTGSLSLSLSTIIPSMFHTFNFSSLSHSDNLRSVPSLKATSLDSASSSSYCFFLLPFKEQFLQQFPTFSTSLPHCSAKATSGLLVLQSETLQLFLGIPAAFYSVDHLVLANLLSWLL